MKRSITKQKKALLDRLLMATDTEKIIIIQQYALGVDHLGAEEILDNIPNELLTTVYSALKTIQFGRIYAMSSVTLKEHLGRI